MDMLQALTDTLWAMGWKFFLQTGLKLGEAIAAKWKDIDFDKKQLTVRHNAVVVKMHAKRNTCCLIEIS